jgi:hypothetical protein
MKNLFVQTHLNVNQLANQSNQTILPPNSHNRNLCASHRGISCADEQGANDLIDQPGKPLAGQGRSCSLKH